MFCPTEEQQALATLASLQLNVLNMAVLVLCIFEAFKTSIINQGNDFCDDLLVMKIDICYLDVCEFRGAYLCKPISINKFTNWEYMAIHIRVGLCCCMFVIFSKEV